MAAKVRYDSLGRRIPTFDRKAAAEKGKHGDKDLYRRTGALGGSKRTRGYLGYLKDTDPTKLEEIRAKGLAKSKETRQSKKRIKKP